MRFSSIHASSAAISTLVSSTASVQHSWRRLRRNRRRKLSPWQPRSNASRNRSRLRRVLRTIRGRHCEAGVAEGAGSPNAPRLEVTPLGNGRYSVTDGTRQRLAYAAGPPEERWVFIDGRVYVIDVTGGRRQRAHDDEMALA